MNTSVVIPNWNGQKFIKDCLQSLQKQTLKPNVIVVDNGSTDDSIKIVEADFPSVEVIKLVKNHGFAGGVNKGIQKAMSNGAKYIALFNNDAVADKDWLKNLVRAADRQNECGIITSKLMQSDKKHIDSTGEFVTTRGMPFPRGRGQTDKGQYDEAGSVFGASGGASLYRVDMLKIIGLFDEDFFAYFEDVDISFRAQLAGFKVWYEPSAVAYHHVGGTSSRLGNFARYHSIKNLIYLYNKNMPGLLFWKYKLLLFYQLVRMAAGAIRDGMFCAYIRAFGKAVLMMPRTWRKRHNVQKMRTTTVSYIDDLLVHTAPPQKSKT